MEYSYEFDPASGICLVRVTGRHKRPEDSFILQEFARKLGKEHDCQKFLFDMRLAEIIGGTMETYETGTVPVDVDHTQHTQKIALLYEGILSEHKFLETVATNRWYQLRVFNNLDHAMHWLNSVASKQFDQKGHDLNKK